MRKHASRVVQSTRTDGGYEPLTVNLTHMLNERAGINWSSHSHTEAPVPVSAIGPGQKIFDGEYDHTEIAKKIMTVAQLE